uniref:Protein kinase domain-containing protein n=1 Tax=Steinernema glaseri TaxID=37863 RepID=A0A1I7YMY0_9BILA
AKKKSTVKASKEKVSTPDQKSTFKSVRNEKEEEKTKRGKETKGKTPDKSPDKNEPLPSSKQVDAKKKSRVIVKKPSMENANTVEDATLCHDAGEQEEAPITKVHLNAGDVITIVDKEYHVDSMLTKGLVGQIYQVTNTSTKERKQYVLKSEDISYKGKRLRNEIVFLKALLEVGKPNQLPTLYTTGRNDTCRFMVIDVVGYGIQQRT